jgi:hypothetical protein
MVQKTLTVFSIVVIGFLLMGLFGWGSSADTNVNEVIKLLRAGVGEEVIKAHIENEDMTFELLTKDLINLKKAGASDDLLAFMVKGSVSSGDFPFEIEEFVVKKPTVHEHLAIYPVFRKVAFDIEDYLTLDEAQKAKVIVITERESGSVPVVVIRNIGSKPIYIMAGEIIIGGKQDRMVSHDVLILPGKIIEVSVRCVEHGRWHGKSHEFKSGGAVGIGSVRSALQFKAQQDVWNEVAKAVEKNQAGSQSGTYGAMLSNEDIEERSKPFLYAMDKGLGEKEMVGFIMALNGEVVCVDIFTNPKFFAKVKEKLIKAYVLDAISAEIASKEVPGKDDIIQFFDELKVAQTEELKRYEANCNFELESERMIGNASRDDDGKLQHLNLYKQ